MKHEKVLSVSVASYNVEKYIAKCLESFINTQILDDVEILVISDGSKDRTVEISKEYESRYPDSIKVIEKENGGHGSTINKGIELATGKYFKIVDADDWVDQEGIEKLVENLKKSDVDLVVNDYCYVNPDGIKTRDIISVDRANVELNKKLDYKEVGKYIPLYMHSFTIKTEILKNMSERIDEHMFYVDAEYVIFPLRHINSVIALDFPVYMYLYGTTEQSMNVDNWVKRREQHRKVLVRVINYYNDNYDLIPDEVKQIILSRIKGLAITQYLLYFSMEASDAQRDELLAFDSELETLNSDIYKMVRENGRLIKAFDIIKNKKGFIYKFGMKTFRKRSIVSLSSN